jgi:hypothetical protein
VVFCETNPNFKLERSRPVRATLEVGGVAFIDENGGGQGAPSKAAKAAEAARTGREVFAKRTQFLERSEAGLSANLEFAGIEFIDENSVLAEFIRQHGGRYSLMRTRSLQPCLLLSAKRTLGWAVSNVAF